MLDIPLRGEQAVGRSMEIPVEWIENAKRIRQETSQSTQTQTTTCT
jgi:hypothetical protein